MMTIVMTIVMANNIEITVQDNKIHLDIQTLKYYLQR